MRVVSHYRSNLRIISVEGFETDIAGEPCLELVGPECATTPTCIVVHGILTIIPLLFSSQADQ